MKTNQLPDGQLMEITMTADPDVFEVKPFFEIAEEKTFTPFLDFDKVKEVSYTITITNVSRLNAEAAFAELNKFPMIDKLVIANSHFLTDPDDGLPSPFAYLLQIMKTRSDIEIYDISDVYFQDHQLTTLGKGLWNASNNKESGKRHDWITGIRYKNSRQTKDNEILDNFVLRNRREDCIHCAFSTPTEPTPSSMDILYDLCLRVADYQTENPNKTFIFAKNVAFVGSQKFIPKPPEEPKLEAPLPPTQAVEKPTLATRAYSASFYAVKLVEDSVIAAAQMAKGLVIKDSPKEEEEAELQQRNSTSSSTSAVSRWEMVRPTHWIKKLEPSSNSRNETSKSNL